MARSINNNRQLVLIAHNIRSIYNVGSLFRTAEGLGLDQLIISGYTPYPREPKDTRLEHLIINQERQISKTALGAQNHLSWRRTEDLIGTIEDFRSKGFYIYGLEQDHKSKSLLEVIPKKKSVIILGNELTGLDKEIMKECGTILEIPMFGHKESFNVASAAAMALFYFKFYKIN